MVHFQSEGRINRIESCARARQKGSFFWIDYRVMIEICVLKLDIVDIGNFDVLISFSYID